MCLTGLTGASGTGKTSTVRLLTDMDPITEHDSTPILKPMEYFQLDSDSEESESDCSDDDQEVAPSENVPATECVSLLKRYMLIYKKKGRKWEPASQDALLHRLASYVVQAVESHNEASTRKHKKSCLSMMMKGSFFAHRLGSLADGHTDAPSKENGATAATTTTGSSLANMSFDDLHATREILKFIDSKPNLKDFGVTHFVNVMDTGGQAGFMDIAPALMRFSHVNLVLIRLDEDLNGLVKFFYSVRGRIIGFEKRQATTKSLVYSIMSSRSKIQSPSIEGIESIKSHEQSVFMILATHLDKYQEMINRAESLSDKDKQLEKLLKEFENFIIPNGDKLIFALNALARDDETKRMASTIRKLAMEHYTEAEIPVCWYIFQVAISEMKVTSKNPDTIHISKFVEIGRIIAMPEDEVKASLQYFHEMSIVLYYPDILPNVVFTTPQFLLDIISDIIAISLGKVDTGATRGERRKLQNQGVFKKSLLKHVSKGFEEDLFTPDDFVHLMSYLFIISQLPDTDEYFIPCVLQTADMPFADLPESSIAVAPLLLTWNETVPNGLFPSLVTCMQSGFTKELIRFQMSTARSQYRNRISFDCHKLACVVTLIECNSFIAVASTCNVREYCPEVRDAVLTAIEAVVQRFDWLPLVSYPEEGFLCKIMKCPFKDNHHLCYPDVKKGILSCSWDSFVTTAITDEQSIWLNGTGELCGC